MNEATITFKVPETGHILLYAVIITACTGNKHMVNEMCQTVVSSLCI